MTAANASATVGLNTTTALGKGALFFVVLFAIMVLS